MPPRPAARGVKRRTGATVGSTAAKAIDDLPLSRDSAAALKDIQAEVADAYRERFIEMTETMRHQASALARIQETLSVLVHAVAPQLDGTVPVAVRVAHDDETPDVASSIVVADPIGAGFTLSQTDVAKALGLPNAADVSVLVRAFGLDKNGDCAVVVRRGNRNTIVNYHPRAVAAFAKQVAAPPASLTPEQQSALKRVRARLSAPTG